MVLDVGLVLEQHQRLDDEALDQLGSPVVTNARISSSENTSAALCAWLSQSRSESSSGCARNSSRTRGSRPRFIDAAFELRPAPVGSDRRPESRSRSRRPCGAPLCMLFVIVLEPSCPLSGSTPKRTRREPARSIRSGRGNWGAGVTPVGRPDHSRSQNPAVPASRLAGTRERSVASGLASFLERSGRNGQRSTDFTPPASRAFAKTPQPAKTCRFARKSAGARDDLFRHRHRESRFGGVFASSRLGLGVQRFPTRGH